MTYDGVVQEMKRDPQKVTLMLLQPYEKQVLKRRGLELSSKTCPAQIVNGRTERDDTTSVSIYTDFDVCKSRSRNQGIHKGIYVNRP